MESAKSVEAGTSRGVGSERNKQREMKNEKPLSEVQYDSGDEEEEEGEEEEKEDVGDGKEGNRVVSRFSPGPLVSLKEQMEKDKEDDNLRRWKEKLLGCIEADLNGQMEPEVKFHSIGIISDDLGEITTPLLLNEIQNGFVLSSLKEGSRYRLKITFSVRPVKTLVQYCRRSRRRRRGGEQKRRERRRKERERV